MGICFTLTLEGQGNIKFCPLVGLSLLWYHICCHQSGNGKPAGLI